MTYSPTAYIDLDYLIATTGNRVYQVLGVANGSDVSADDRALNAVASANARVDSSIRTKYLPADVKDLPDVKNCAVTLAVWALFQCRPDLEVSIDSQANHQAAIQFLRDVQKGAQKGGIDLTYKPQDRAEDLGAAAAVNVGSSTAVGATSADSPGVWYDRW